MNRAVIQKKVKFNPIVQFLSTLYFYYKAQCLLKKQNMWIDFQTEELTRIVRYAKNHSAYYSNLLCGKIIAKETIIQTVKDLPLLDKSIIRSNYHDIVSDEISENWPILLNTGGSTGEPLCFPALYKGKHFENINQMILYVRMGFKPGDTIATFAGREIDQERQNKHLFWDKCENFPTGKLNFSTLYLNDINIKYYYQALENLKPQFIRGYPSGILEFCKLCIKNELELSIQLKGIYLTSENFSEDESKFLTNFLNCPIYGQYGHTESSIFAYKDPDSQSYLCSPLYGYTEILDEQGAHVNVGEDGEIVVSGFTQYGLPFIRYKTGDLATYGGQTANGEVILRKLLGRDVDFLINKKRERIYLVGFLFGGHIRAFNYIQSWQIQQSEPGYVILLIVKAKGFNKSIEDELIEHFRNKLIDVKIQYVDAISKTLAGKQKFLIQKLK